MSQANDTSVVPEGHTCLHSDTWFDRTICPEPCGMMHEVCKACGQIAEHCANFAEAGDVQS